MSESDPEPHHAERRARRLVLAAFVILPVLVALTLRSCVYYDYGVAADSPSIAYDCRYFGCADDPYQFTTTLFATATRDRFPQHFALVEIDHLRRPYYEKTGAFESVLRAEIYDGEGMLDVESVSVTHTLDGDLLAPSSVVVDTAGRCTSCDRTALLTEIRYIYSPVRPRGSLIERVRFDLLRDGVRTPYEYEFSLEYRFHYSYWDALMGI